MWHFISIKKSISSKLGVVNQEPKAPAAVLVRLVNNGGSSMDKARNLLIVGLRNAHAMESQAQELMERQIERTDEYPEVQSRLREHLDETHQQIARLEDCLRLCGESASTLKDTATSLMANAHVMMNAMAGDEILKNTLANSAFEHFEIAAYKSMLALCQEAGVDLAAPLKQSLREEEQMAQWIDSHVEGITLQYLAKEEEAVA
jgi:ferritin-like metal-binding protein YciE